MVTTKVSKKYLTSVQLEAGDKFGIEVGDGLEWLPMATEIVVKPKRKRTDEDLPVQIVGLVEAGPSDVTRDHNKILYG